MANTNATAINQIKERIVQRGKCWTWAGSTTTAGYGQVSIAGRPMYVHRLMYERYVGPLGEGMEIAHKCGNKTCVNPSHLLQTTHAVNMTHHYNSSRRIEAA